MQGSTIPFSQDNRLHLSQNPETGYTCLVTSYPQLVIFAQGIDCCQIALILAGKNVHNYTKQLKIMEKLLCDFAEKNPVPVWISEKLHVMIRAHSFKFVLKIKDYRAV
jgi:hypothetical protein